MCGLAFVTSLTLPISEAGKPFRNPMRARTKVEDLAEKIDKLERALQYHGRVTAKTPDVWGQARLTQHRREFEEQMAAQLTTFEPNLNAEMSVSDQAFLSEAVALSAASRGQTVPELTTVTSATSTFTPAPVPGEPTDPATSTTNVFTRTAPFGAFGKSTGQGSLPLSLEPEILLDQRKRFLDHLHEIRRVNEGDDTADAPGYSLNLVRVPVSVIPGDKTRENYGAEITITAEPHVTEELLPSTFRELVVNDLIDQLALPIVKVLDLTWKEHLEGEKLWEDIQKSTREMVRMQSMQRDVDGARDIAQLTEIAQRYGVTVDPTKLIKDAELKVAATSRTRSAAVLSADTSPFDVKQPATPLNQAPNQTWQLRFKGELEKQIQDGVYQAVEDKKAKTSPLLLRVPAAANESSGLSPAKSDIQLTAHVSIPTSKPAQSSTPTVLNHREKDLVAVSAAKASLTVVIQQFIEQANGRASTAYNLRSELIDAAKEKVSVQVPRERRSRYPIPATQIKNVFGGEEIHKLTAAVFRARDRFQCRDRIHLPDVQGFLRNELEHAYDFLSSTACPPGVGPGSEGVEFAGGLWSLLDQLSPHDIRQPQRVIDRRERFFHGLPPNPASVSGLSVFTSGTGSHSNCAETATEALAWAILVESSLLNQQLNEDLQRVSRDPACHCVPTGQPFGFYGPNPDPGARQAFVEYVKCRWPIRVFALDPVAQQQNVADSFSLRREMQLAVALAFKQQFVNAQSLTRYMRRIEQDIRTISLNPTAVAFGSGDDTFGWRFFPRVQTPDVEGTLTVIGRDLIAGGPNRDQGLRRRRIEPGMRECTALIVMPSFVKHVRFDVRTNWFPLVPCHVTKTLHTARTPASMETTVEWSKLIRSMEDSVLMCVKDEHRYRDGEVERMLKRARQLSSELPLNTMHAQVPYENTLGGFEMFASGVADLAPELVGFYGAPGIDPNSPTELFLVGDHFSVHDTHILAGNREVSFKMLSRNVMQATIPVGVRIEPRLCTPRETTRPCNADGCNDPHVEVRLATPYGVSSALYVPVVVGSTVVLPDLRWERNAYHMTYRWTTDGTTFNVADSDMLAAAPHQFVLNFPANYWNAQSRAGLTFDIQAESLGLKALGAVTLAPASISGGKRIIGTTEFSQLHRVVRDAVLTHLKNQPIPPSEPPPTLTVRLVATAVIETESPDMPPVTESKEFPVGDELSIRIRFARK